MASSASIMVGANGAAGCDTVEMARVGHIAPTDRYRGKTQHVSLLCSCCYYNMQTVCRRRGVDAGHVVREFYLKPVMPMCPS